MDLSALYFTKCPKCQKLSLSTVSPLEPSREEGQILDWECPYCLNILSEEEWKKNIIHELEEDFEIKEGDFRSGGVFKYMPGEISPEKAKEMAIEYMKNLKTDYPASFKNIRISDPNGEWWVDFKKILPKGLIVDPDTYCVSINKKTGEINLIA